MIKDDLSNILTYHLDNQIKIVGCSLSKPRGLKNTRRKTTYTGTFIFSYSQQTTYA